MRLGFVGGGVMGEAIIAGLLKQGVAVAGDVTVSDVLHPRRAFLRSTYGVNVVSEIAKAIEEADVIVLAIKPQDLAGVLALANACEIADYGESDGSVVDWVRSLIPVRRA